MANPDRKATGDVSHHKQPPKPPPGLWERPDVVQLLADRDIGAVVRIFRKWTGASQTDVGMLVGLPQPHISEIERGSRKVTSLELVERFAEGLQIPRKLVGLADADIENMPEQGVVAESRRQWLRTRQSLGLHRGALTQLVSNIYPEAIRLGNTGMLMPARWRLAKPADLADVRLRWQESTPRPLITGAEREARRVRPLVTPTREYTRYHRAMRELARPRLFENRLTYRLLDVAPEGDDQQPCLELSLTLGEMCYFDMIDVGETLAHEVALVAVNDKDQIRPEEVRWENLSFRRLIRDPFELASYPLMTSISTLTVRSSRAGSTFFLLRRNPAKVAIAGGMLSVFPTGVFQPASVLPVPESPDFDLWRNVMREYSEEFLGNPEHDGDGPPIDYATEEPFRTLDAARRAGHIRVFALGAGVDALNYVGDLLTVAVFEASTFDSLFGEMVDENDEGEVDAEEFSFDGPTIHRLLTSESMAPSGAACLHLAWEHREVILSGAA
ncbi:helix-turn-helix domain-containing protein [Micromonospora zhanjiangensis]|uniref:Helix-turn-helix domain-containing protein n=1 Tax=Micromonospora zhanjiangensis TaxID=1522057 RepID=A0ABV8KPK6_9ACTN